MYSRFIKSFLTTTVCILLYNFLYAQTSKIDFLKKRLLTEKESEAQLKLIINICEQNFSLPVNSFLYYILHGEKLVKHNSPEYFRIKNFYSIYLSKNDRTPEALLLNDSLRKILPAKKEYEKIAEMLEVRRCGLLIRNNQPKDAIEKALMLLEQAEKNHDTLMIVRNCSIFLGWANMELDKYTEAIRWLRFGDNYGASEEILKQCNSLYSNMASCYNNLKKYDSAFYFVEIALKYCRQNEELTGMANALNIRADIHINTHNLIAAENDMKEALQVREKMGDQLYIISDMAQLSLFYASTHQTDKGIETAKKGIELARKSNNIAKLLFLYNALAENYKTAGMQDQYAASLVSILKLKDTLQKENTTQAVAEMEAKYQLQKKENIINKQNYELNRSRYTTIGSLFLLIAGSLFVWLLYRNYRLSQKRKMDLALAEQKLLSYKAVEQAEEKERKRIAADLHDNLGAYAAAISSNVKHLKENSASSENNNILIQLDENAQNIVTQLGDTIWVLKNEHLHLTKLADRFKIWLQRLIKNYPEVKYYYEESISNDLELTPSIILQVFLILKECINNALKHSHCTEIKISFSCHDECIISIEDNGIGFDTPEQFTTTNGLHNMRKRAADCGWSIEWKKVMPSGTCVTLKSSTTK